MSVIQKLNCRMEIASMNFQFHLTALMFDLTKRQTGQRWRRIRERYIKNYPGMEF